MNSRLVFFLGSVGVSVFTRLGTDKSNTGQNITPSNAIDVAYFEIHCLLFIILFGFAVIILYNVVTYA